MITNRLPPSQVGQAPMRMAIQTPDGGGAAGIIARADIDGSIQRIYQRFSEVSRLSGDEIRFRISDITTYLPDQFGDVLWFDLFDLPTGAVIETVPYERLGALPSDSVVSLRCEWRQAEAAQSDVEELLRETGPLRVSEALELLVAWKPERLAGTAAVSSFKVEVDFQGRSRSYRALVLWKPLSFDTLLFTLVDRVVPGGDWIFEDDRPVVSREDLAGSFSAPPGLQTRAPCEVGAFDLFGPPLAAPTQTDGHSSGGHSASFKVGRHCQTYSYCLATCQPYAAYWSCAEYGSISNPLLKHNKATTFQFSSVDGWNGADAACGGALGCAIEQCVIGFCSGVSFGVTGYGASIKVSATSSVLADMSLNHGGFCPGAVEVDPGGCFASVTKVTALELTGGGGPVELPSAEIVLRRLENSDVVHHGQRVRYVMGEWALVSHAPGGAQTAPTTRILSSSSPAIQPALAEGVSAALSAELGTRRGGTGERTTLIVAVPPHEPNSRKIPMPDFRVAAEPMPAGLGRGEVLVRADFAEDHHLQGLEILYETVGGVSRQLALYLEKAISLERHSDEEHRVVVFALLSVGDSLGIESTISYLPRCCCGEVHCI